MTKKLILIKLFTRDFSLLLCQIWGKSYKTFLGKKLTMFPKNVFVFQNGYVTNYRNPAVNKEINIIILNYLRKNPRFLKERLIYYKEKSEYLTAYIQRKEVTRADLLRFVDLLIDYWPAIYLSLNIPMTRNFKLHDRKLVQGFREQTHDIEYRLFNYLDYCLKRFYPALSIGRRSIVSLQEIKSRRFNSTRRGSNSDKIIMIDDKIITGKYFNKLKKLYNFELEQNKESGSKTVLKGRVTCSGIVKGKVRLIMRNSEVKNLKSEEILVTAMTTPNFLPAMKKAAAFITDEGGITCHAAIIARELNKPCIIGTKEATSILRTGDTIEVDANKGIVKLIS